LGIVDRQGPEGYLILSDRNRTQPDFCPSLKTLQAAGKYGLQRSQATPSKKAVKDEDGQ
jgi:hypothetical protein